MNGVAVVIGKTRSDKTEQLENAMTRYLLISNLTSAIVANMWQMSAFPVKVDPPGSIGDTTPLCSIAGMT